MTGIAGHDAGMCGHDETEYAVSGISGNSDEYAAMEIGVHGFR
jgi:hypothetical protein